MNEWTNLLTFQNLLADHKYSTNRVHLVNKIYLIRESSFNMTSGGGGDEDIETRSLKF